MSVGQTISATVMDRRYKEWNEPDSCDPRRCDWRFHPHAARAEGVAPCIFSRTHRDPRLQAYRGAGGKSVLRPSRPLNRARTARELLREEFGTPDRTRKLFRELQFNHQLSLRSRWRL